MSKKVLFTSESVTEGHPDKIADQISDAILDAILAQDPNGRVACETIVTTGQVHVFGEITTTAYVPIPQVIRKTINDIGYTDARYGFDGESVGINVAIDEQSPDIAMGVNQSLEAKEKKADLASGTEAAKAIMTTDTKKKEVAVTFMAGDTEVTIGGMAKGSGMIHPNMCTMLAFITTDAKISKKALHAAMSSDVEDTYNMISVDGDTSTNDTALLLANGMAGNEKIKEGTPAFDAFKEALHYVNETLAKAMAGDGEGATALFEVKVVGAQTKEQAKVLAKSVVCSNLTKAAIAGHDANWGRILCAMGYSGAKFDPEQVDLFFESSAGKLQIIANGTETDYSEEKATEILSQEKVTAIADLKAGDAEATAWGCDLTHGYIDINADYRS